MNSRRGRVRRVIQTRAAFMQIDWATGGYGADERVTGRATGSHRESPRTGTTENVRCESTEKHAKKKHGLSCCTAKQRWRGEGEGGGGMTTSKHGEHGVMPLAPLATCHTCPICLFHLPCAVCTPCLQLIARCSAAAHPVLVPDIPLSQPRSSLSHVALRFFVNFAEHANASQAKPSTVS